MATMAMGWAMASVREPLAGAAAQQLPIGDALRDLRRGLRLSQARVAELAEVSQANYSLYEMGRLLPQMGTLMRLARALRVPPSRILHRAEELEQQRHNRRALGELIRTTNPGGSTDEQ